MSKLIRYWILFFCAPLIQNCSQYKISDIPAAPQAKADVASQGFDDIYDEPDMQMPGSGMPTPGMMRPPRASIPDPIVETEEDALAMNSACVKLLGNPPPPGPRIENFTFSGIAKDIRIADAGSVVINGVTDDVIVDRSDSVDISGIHGAVCVRTKLVKSLSGVNGGRRGDVAILNETGALGHVENISGISGSDIVISGFNVESISGVKRNVYIFGGTVKNFSGITESIHLFDGAQIENLSGVHKNLVQH